MLIKVPIMYIYICMCRLLTLIIIIIYCNILESSHTGAAPQDVGDVGLSLSFEPSSIKGLRFRAKGGE